MLAEKGSTYWARITINSAVGKDEPIQAYTNIPDPRGALIRSFSVGFMRTPAV